MTGIDRLWAPWRIKYVKAFKKGHGKGCIFCSAKKKKALNYVIFETEFSISLLNIFPYNNGHTMISPLRHVGAVSDLGNDEILDLFKTLNHTKKILGKVLNPDGYNIGINVSGSAGAGVPEHLHIHLLPRWIGDTNFMPTLYNTKVISQSLNELYKQLKKAVRIYPYVKSKTN